MTFLIVLHPCTCRISVNLLNTPLKNIVELDLLETIVSILSRAYSK